jgi:hypothetical protein
VLERIVVVLILISAAFSGCKKKEQPAPTYPTYGAPGSTPPAPTGGGVPPPGALSPVPMTPALGLLCGSEQDIQCPFARCLGGRCGGCASASDCKAGAQCFPTWLGQACLPALAASPPAASPPAASPPPGDAFERARALCVVRTNDYRARASVAAVARRADREACGDAQARADAGAQTAHGAFGQCAERAQNECPGWSGSPEEVIERCLAMMFAEGPGGGHYTNMTDGHYRGVACGLVSTPQGQLWVVQDFYP